MPRTTSRNDFASSRHIPIAVATTGIGARCLSCFANKAPHARLYQDRHRHRQDHLRKPVTAGVRKHSPDSDFPPDAENSGKNALSGSSYDNLPCLVSIMMHMACELLGERSQTVVGVRRGGDMRFDIRHTVGLLVEHLPSRMTSRSLRRGHPFPRDRRNSASIRAFLAPTAASAAQSPIAVSANKLQCMLLRV